MHLECIVQDACSSDGTASYIIKTYKFVKLVSESDTGIYHAMNKAAGRATGSHLLFLNSGDLLSLKPRTCYILPCLSDNCISIIPLYCYQENSLDVTQIPTEIPQTFYELVRRGICHQTAIIPKSLFYQLGYYELTYKVKADHDFFIRAWQQGYAFEEIKECGLYCTWEINSGYTTQNLLLAHIESLQLVFRYHKLLLPKSLHSMLVFLLSFCVSTIIGKLRTNDPTLDSCTSTKPYHLP